MTRFLRPALVFLLLPTLDTSAAEPQPNLLMGEMHMRNGQHRLAASAFRSQLEARPNSGRAMVGLARALSAIGACGEVFALVERVRGKPAWGASGATAEAQCLSRAGDLSGARVAYEEAASLAPNRPAVWMALASIGESLGDAALVERARDELLLARTGEVLLAIVDAEAALDRGDPSFDELLASVAVLSGKAGSRYAILDARRWLDLDDPIEAQAVLLEAIPRDMNNLHLALWRAEAARRAGDLLGARAALSRPHIRNQLDGPLAIEILVRLLVDEGELAEAERLLATHPRSSDAGALASAWYLARAQGDPRVEELAEAWRAGDLNPHRTLDLLVPIHRRESR